MEPVPTSFHLGPLTFHTYGFGLAIAMYVAYRYGEHRLKQRGIPTEHFASFTITLIVVALIGARVAHVLTNLGLYSSHPLKVFAVWQGGLASFGALAAAIPVGWVLARRWWLETGLMAFADALIPAVVLGWAIGRFLGPQFMVGGGGHETHQWFGMRYAGQEGRRVPVPLIQGLEDAALLGLLLFVEKRAASRGPGLVTGVALIIWGIVRALDERLLLGQEGWTGSIGVQIAGLVMALCGVVIVLRVPRSAKTPVSN